MSIKVCKAQKALYILQISELRPLKNFLYFSLVYFNTVDTNNKSQIKCSLYEPQIQLVYPQHFGPVDTFWRSSSITHFIQTFVIVLSNTIGLRSGHRLIWSFSGSSINSGPVIISATMYGRA